MLSISVVVIGTGAPSDLLSGADREAGDTHPAFLLAGNVVSWTGMHVR